MRMLETLEYTSFGRVTNQKINVLILILDHLFRCKNQRRVCLPYFRLCSALFVKRLKNEEKSCHFRAIKVIDYDMIFTKIVVRKNKKARICQDPLKDIEKEEAI